MQNQKKFDITSILVVGGLTFTGFNFIQWMRKHQKKVKVVCVDSMTDNDPFQSLKLEWIDKHKVPFYKYIPLDDRIAIVADLENIDCIVNCVNESFYISPDLSTHPIVDYALLSKITCNLLQISLRRKARFHQLGSLFKYGVREGSAATTIEEIDEEHPFDIFDMLTTAKDSADLMAIAFACSPSHEKPVTISNASFLFGPWQLWTAEGEWQNRAIVADCMFRLVSGIDKRKKDIAINANVNAYTYIDYHSECLWKILQYGESGEIYNISEHLKGETSHLATEDQIFSMLAKYLEEYGNPPLTKKFKFLNTYHNINPKILIGDKVKNAFKIKKSKMSFEDELKSTLKWFKDTVVIKVVFNEGKEKTNNEN